MINKAKRYFNEIFRQKANKRVLKKDKIYDIQTIIISITNDSEKKND